MNVLSSSLNSLKGHLGDELGYCPQADALDPYMSGRETLHFHAKLRGFDSRLAKALVSEQLKRLQLESLADKPVHTYSGGNKRKLALAVAMLGDPPLLLLVSKAVGLCRGSSLPFGFFPVLQAVFGINWEMHSSKMYLRENCTDGKCTQWSCTDGKCTHGKEEKKEYAREMYTRKMYVCV